MLVLHISIEVKRKMLDHELNIYSSLYYRNNQQSTYYNIILKIKMIFKNFFFIVLKFYKIIQNIIIVLGTSKFVVKNN